MKCLRFFFILCLFICGVNFSFASNLDNDSVRSIQRISFQTRTGYLMSNFPFFRGNNLKRLPINSTSSAHLEYSFQSAKGTWVDAVYGSPYQGIGVSANTFMNNREIGAPNAIYLLQGARICSFSPLLSLNYEWNFGISFGWKEYNELTNPMNTAIGSDINAYINSDVYLRWALTNNIDLSGGVSFTHFSNGNTKTPNVGLNIISAGVDLTYNFGSKYRKYTKPNNINRDKFPAHLSYELMFFSSWKRKGLRLDEEELEYKYQGKRFLVGGISFAPVYAISYRFRVGASLDLTYDESASTKYIITAGTFSYERPSIDNQISVGLAARIDYTMPYFTISTTMGYNVINAQRHTDAIYQTLALKVNVLKDMFLSVGYSTIDFTKANYMMFGLGFRFNTYR